MEYILLVIELFIVYGGGIMEERMKSLKVVIDRGIYIYENYGKMILVNVVFVFLGYENF